MSAFVVAEIEALELGAALYDARFARTILFFLGLVIIVGAFYLGTMPGVIFGILTMLGGWYFSAYKIPHLEAELRVSRGKLAQAIERLGQYRSHGCE